MKKCAVLIVAAGRGRRFGEGIPKQYQLLHGRMVLRHSLSIFAAHPEISAVKAVIHPDDIDLYNTAAEGLDLLPFAIGGATRQESVCLGLESLKEENPDIVLIHDGARPFISAATISDIIAEIKDGQGAIAAIPVTDTIKQTRKPDEKTIAGSVDRSTLWRAQTPQGFVYSEILAVHEQYRGQEADFTDDASLFEAAGKTVRLVQASETNIKITSAEDLAKANAVTQTPEIRVGQGFDVHAFTEGDGVNLCGVKIPYSQSLLGHSDADVAWHALTDALYGSIAAGDIGLHFPPSEAKWKGAPSEIFLKHAASLITALGGSINNVDITIVCEEPKVTPYRQEMSKKTAEVLGISRDKVSIKGTTSEKLGFTGRKEGIAAFATATISK
ncbi:MAG: bifunctional 2-C-methyl-D-erythritol 4-phosphate cytidylyltransferase/2-C-methyl-D-erythritol 2,4-cyclodiphosphate synthase [Alphaproteobacteria bacterium]|nr:bifunctional 2-C-methyl-D-erythritol 4-phosphate cytidylyltransferase/2-C-methyl-D-erythritol 2,4-cyclodiphosphate synthase [Alphaproteobacteria bacterium]